MSATIILLSGGAGVLIGGLYLGLLWLGVRHLPRERGVPVFLGLALARMAVLVGALAAAATLGTPAEGLVAALAGFVAVRFAATRLSGRGTPGDAAWK
ncbi:ATP synthase subunit I [Breoghania sp. L-A4]|uniref:N-ATPase subunit AtpR n=1 Tax=Breoghania sp. L-A4 TaxID=2304600 RepID=UPI000E35DCEE|nr:ATP synthase subunit I [Breoghania sp. L-A4]AXS41492.1 hypothetical protein D1F64_17610 [Breoghania sp. L-A4]